MLRAVIVDDEQNNAEHLQRLLLEHAEVEVIAYADNAAAAYDAIRQHRPDLVFLDIQMPYESGFGLLARFNNPAFEVIFVTAYDQYGIEAIKFSALDYLLKPVDAGELKKAIIKATDRLNHKQKAHSLENLLSFFKATSKEQQKIALPLQNEIRYVPVMTITYFEASNNYSKVYTGEVQPLLVCKTLKEFAVLLKSYGFVRAHQSYLVNTRFVQSYLKEDGGTLLLTDKTKIPVSKAHRAEVKKVLDQFS